VRARINVIYAFLTDGLDYERREEFDRKLLERAPDDKSKAKREREALTALTNIPGVAGGA
jgi:hypothetical protein